MINSASLTHVSGSYTCAINTDIIPLHDFDVTVSQRVDTSRQKSQDHGLWPTIPYRDGMEIHMEGDIFGTSSADYFTNRMTLVAALFGNPNTTPVLPSDAKTGTLQLNIAGATEDWKCDYVITLFSAPLQGLSPSRTPWACTVVSWSPWFIGVTSGDFYFYS